MNIKKFLCSVITAGAMLASGIAASAEEVIMAPVAEQIDYISGKVNVITTTDSNTYVTITKITPECPDGYTVYDSVIEADSVHVSRAFAFNLECNNFNYESGTIESKYIVKVGIPKYKTSSEPVYYQTEMVIEDTDYVGYETEYTFNVNLTNEVLTAPLSEVTPTEHGKTINLTFTSLATVPGDANSDGVTNIRDAAFIARKLAEQKGSEIPPYADFNGDGLVNIRDAAAIAAYLAKPVK